MEYIIILLAIIAISTTKKTRKTYNRKSRRINTQNNTTQQPEPTEVPEEITEAEAKQEFPYKKKNLLTKSEFRFFMMLKAAAQSENILVCPKVRLEDFIQTTSIEEKMKYRGYIRSRHVDFLLCDAKTMRILAAIELDDETHYNAKSQKIDSFKNNLFNAVEIPLMRIKPGSDFGAVIANILADIKAPKKQNTTNPE